MWSLVLPHRGLSFPIRNGEAGGAARTGLKPLVSPGTFPGAQPHAPASPSLPARPPPPPPPRRPSPPRQGPVSSGRRECYFDTAAPDACDNILARNVTWQECCCTVGEGWGSGCRIQQCPSTETGGHGPRGARRAEGLGRNRWTWDWAGTRGHSWTRGRGAGIALGKGDLPARWASG